MVSDRFKSLSILNLNIRACVNYPGRSEAGVSIRLAKTEMSPKRYQ